MPIVFVIISLTNRLFPLLWQFFLIPNTKYDLEDDRFQLSFTLFEDNVSAAEVIKRILRLRSRVVSRYFKGEGRGLFQGTIPVRITGNPDEIRTGYTSNSSV
jgi:hypothetical protein